MDLKLAQSIREGELTTTTGDDEKDLFALVDALEALDASSIEALMEATGGGIAEAKKAASTLLGRADGFILASGNYGIHDCIIGTWTTGDAITGAGNNYGTVDGILGLAGAGNGVTINDAPFSGSGILEEIINTGNDEDEIVDGTPSCFASVFGSGGAGNDERILTDNIIGRADNDCLSTLSAACNVKVNFSNKTLGAVIENIILRKSSAFSLAKEVLFTCRGQDTVRMVAGYREALKSRGSGAVYVLYGPGCDDVTLVGQTVTLGAPPKLNQNGSIDMAALLASRKERYSRVD